MDMRVLHGKGPMPHSTCPVADLRQVARLPRRCANVRRSLRVAAQTAGTKERQKASTETEKAKPTSSADTTHVPIQTGEPTDPDHVTNGVGSSGPNIEVDSVLAKELSENGVYTACCYGDQSRRPCRNLCSACSFHVMLCVRAIGFRSTRRTKIICTIGPKSCSTEMLATLAAGGMNCARLNMSHGDHEWHKTVIERIRKLNKDNGCVMMMFTAISTAFFYCEPVPSSMCKLQVLCGNHDGHRGQ